DRFSRIADFLPHGFPNFGKPSFRRRTNPSPGETAAYFLSTVLQMFIKQFRHWHGPCKQPPVSVFLPSLHPLTRPRQRAFFVLAALLAPAIYGQVALTLDDAVRLALERNPQIKVEAFGRSIARADLLTAYGRFDPAL